MDLWHETLFDDPRLWAADRLHLNAIGHERVTGAALDALNLPSTDWRTPLPVEPPPARLEAVREDAAWFTHHLAPWLARRALRKSSGDGIEPKRPDLQPLSEAATA